MVFNKYGGVIVFDVAVEAKDSMQGPDLVKTWTFKITCNSMLDYALAQLADTEVPIKAKGNTMSACA